MSDQEKIRLKELIAEGDLAVVFDELSVYLTEQSTLLLNDLLLLEGRYKRLQKDISTGVINYATTQQFLNKISQELLYFIDQIPDTTKVEKPVIFGRRSGKVLHDIPELLPLKKLTKCVVRIAETEELVRKDFPDSQATQVEDITIARDMSVELFELGNGGNFEIKTVNSAAQSVDAFETTQWTFYVRPLVEGDHLLFLKITILQQVDGKELIKETVLERMVEVTAELLVTPPQKSWQKTEIEVVTGSELEADFGSYSSAPPPPVYVPLNAPQEELQSEPPLPPARKPENKKRSKFSLLAPLLLIGGVTFAFATGGYSFFSRDGVNPTIDDASSKNDTLLEVTVPDSALQNVKELEPQVVKIQPDSTENNSAEIDTEIPIGPTNSSTLSQKNPHSEEERNVQLDPAVNNAPPSLIPNEPSLTVDSNKETAPPVAIAPPVIDSDYRIFSKMARKEAVSTGQPIYIGVETKDFDVSQLRFIINNNQYLKPERQEGTRLYFKLRSSRNSLRLEIRDNISKTSHVQELSGGNNATVFLRKLDN